MLICSNCQKRIEEVTIRGECPYCGAKVEAKPPSKPIQINNNVVKKEEEKKEVVKTLSYKPVISPKFALSECKSHSFPVMEHTLEVSEEMDRFNSIRLIFRDMANTSVNNLTLEYANNIKTLDDFLSYFPSLYEKHIDPLIKKANEILISEEVWSVTYDSFLDQHLVDFHLAMDDYKVILENLNATAEANYRRKANAWNHVPGMIGGGFGLMGALKGMAQATAYNLIRDGIEANALRNVNVSPQQKAVILQGLNLNVFFERIFLDYWRVFLSLVWTLNQNGKNISWYTTNKSQEVENIFKNLSHPGFPQDRILEVLLDIIQKYPYNADFYKFFIKKYGDTEELKAIRNYFGYFTFDHPRIV